jgi:hypothetical protein
MRSRKTIGSDFTKPRRSVGESSTGYGISSFGVAEAETWARDLLLAVDYCPKDLIHDKQLQVIEQKTGPQ